MLADELVGLLERVGLAETGLVRGCVPGHAVTGRNGTGMPSRSWSGPGAASDIHPGGLLRIICNSPRVSGDRPGGTGGVDDGEGGPDGDTAQRTDEARVGPGRRHGRTVLALNVVGWSLLLVAVGHHFQVSRTHVFGLGTGVLAFTLGMRHAFDADHIAAIDNTTRKLVQRASAAGRRFLLLARAIPPSSSRGRGPELRHPRPSPSGQGAVLGAALGQHGGGHHRVGGLPLPDRPARPLRAGLHRRCVPPHASRPPRPRGAGATPQQPGLDRALPGPTPSARRAVEDVSGRRAVRPWVRYGDRGSTARSLRSAVAGGLPFYAVLSLPVLFAAGMCLFDTLDGWFMNFAYDWAFSNPVRKVFYNLTITGLSVSVAFFIGTIELLGLLGRRRD